MREISDSKKLQVIKLFLSGEQYGEIVIELGISKGSIVNIINDFRNGNLNLPAPINKYIDTLRQLAVDLKKSGTSVAQVKRYQRIDQKIKAMGVNDEQIEQWLEASQSISSPTVSNKEFIRAALELAGLRSGGKPSYRELVNDYKDKLDGLERLRKELDDVRREISKSNDELGSINREILDTRKKYTNEREGLKLRQDKYLTDHRLSWQKIKLAESLFDSSLQSIDLSKPQRNALRKKVITAGSLSKEITRLKQYKNKVRSANSELIQWNERYAAMVESNIKTAHDWDLSIMKKADESHLLEERLNAQKEELTKLQDGVSGLVDLLYIAHLIIHFLWDKSRLEDYELGKFFDLMVDLKNNRFNNKIKPVIDIDYDAYNINIDKAREMLASLILPLVKDKFVLKLDYDMAKFKHKFFEELAFLQGKLEALDRTHISKLISW